MTQTIERAFAYTLNAVEVTGASKNSSQHCIQHTYSVILAKGSFDCHKFNSIYYTD